MIKESTWDKKLKIAYKAISMVNKEAYKDIYLLSNQVLSKNPFSNSFLKNFLSYKKLSKQRGLTVISKLICYYLWSFIHYLVYLIKFIVFSVSGLRYNLYEDKDELVLIDTFFLTDNIIRSKKFTEQYFKGLDDVLNKTGKHYAYLPVFYGNGNLLKLKSALKIIRQDNIPVLSEYQLLSLKDWLHMIVFIITYPWHVLKFAKSLNKRDRITRLIYHELIDTLDHVTFLDFSRYLQGKRVAHLPYKNIKLISWYENQGIDKNLYKGLRTNPGKVIVYGSQLFLYSKTDLNIIVDDNEMIFDIIPDKIIVNGPYFMPESSMLNYIVGPSLRYGELFKSLNREVNKNDILVLLSYYAEDTENILRLLYKADLSAWHVVIKPHPATPIDKFRYLLLPEWDIVSEGLYSLFESARIVIGSASGSLIEAASLCIPVITIKNICSYDYAIFPEKGRGILWDEAGSAEELMVKIEGFDKFLHERLPEMAEIALWYKKMFFNEPSVENIIRAFDLYENK